MVGGLVQQKNIGLGRDGAGQRGAARFATRKLGGVFVAGKAKLFEQIARAIRIIGVNQPRFNILKHGFEAGEVRLLRQIADGGAGLEKAGALVLLQQSGSNFEQSALARAIAADKTEPVAFGYGKRGPVKERRGAQSEANVLQYQERRCHAPWIEGWAAKSKAECGVDTRIKSAYDALHSAHVYKHGHNPRVIFFLSIPPPFPSCKNFATRPLKLKGKKNVAGCCSNRFHRAARAQGQD